MNTAGRKLAAPYDQVLLAQIAVEASRRSGFEPAAWLVELAEAEPVRVDPPLDEETARRVRQVIDRELQLIARGRRFSRRRAERGLARALREADGEPRFAGWLGLGRRRRGG